MDNKKIARACMLGMWVPLAILYIAGIISGVYQIVLMIKRGMGIAPFLSYLLLVILLVVGIGYVLYDLFKDIKDA